METTTMDMRNRFIITQALVIAIKELDKVPTPFKEVSNIADMKELLNTTFVEFAGVMEFLTCNQDFDAKVQIND